jgi:hypothetical protein
MINGLSVNHQQLVPKSKGGGQTSAIHIYGGTDEVQKIIISRELAAGN